MNWEGSRRNEKDLMRKSKERVVQYGIINKLNSLWLEIEEMRERELWEGDNNRVDFWKRDLIRRTLGSPKNYFLSAGKLPILQKIVATFVVETEARYRALSLFVFPVEKKEKLPLRLLIGLKSSHPGSRLATRCCFLNGGEEISLQSSYHCAVFHLVCKYSHSSPRNTTFPVTYSLFLSLSIQHPYSDIFSYWMGGTWSTQWGRLRMNLGLYLYCILSA